jgi:hypothetical protein
VSKRNIIWMAAILVAGVGVWIAAGPLWGVLAAVGVLIVSEVIERQRRTRIRAARGVTDSPSVKDAIAVRRKRR